MICGDCGQGMTPPRCRCGWVAPTGRAPRMPTHAAPDDVSTFEHTAQSDEIVERMRATTRRPAPDPLEWARRIIARRDAGERVALYAVGLAEAALAPRDIFQRRYRDPGDDDDTAAAA